MGLSNKDTIIAFDIDDVICFRYKEDDLLGVPAKYERCKPYSNIINLVNQYYDDGYYVMLYSSRGQTSLGGDPREIEEIIRPVTEAWLKKWSVRYSELAFGKRHYHVLIDDRAINERDADINTIHEIIARQRP